MPEIKIFFFDQDISSFWFKEGFKLVDSDFLNRLDYKEGKKEQIEL
jgi:hypothetical protein